MRPWPFTPGMAKQQPACVVESSNQKLGFAFFFLMKFEDQLRPPSKSAYQLELLHHYIEKQPSRNAKVPKSTSTGTSNKA